MQNTDANIGVTGMKNRKFNYFYINKFLNVLLAAAYIFYKTKICPYLLQNNCVKGNNCSFAHSEHELRKPIN